MKEFEATLRALAHDFADHGAEVVEDDQGQFLTIPVGYEEAFEVEWMGDTREGPKLAVFYRAWDETGSVSTEERLSRPVFPESIHYVIRNLLDIRAKDDRRLAEDEARHEAEQAEAQARHDEWLVSAEADWLDGRR